MYKHPNHPDDSIDLGRYIQNNDQDNNRFNQHLSMHKNMHTEELHMQISRINSKLEGFCGERLGDLSSCPPREIQKTVLLVETLMSEIRKLQEVKAKLTNQRRQTQQSLLANQQTIDKLTREKKSLQNQKQSIHQKHRNLQKQFKQSSQKSQSEREQLQKQLKQIQARQKAIQAQFRKKDQTLKSMQEGMRKYQDKPVFKNSFDLIQKLEYGPNIYDMCSTNAENQYGRLAKDARDDVVRRLTQENGYLKDCLVNIYKELNTVLELKRETLRNKKGYDGEYENYFQLNSFRPETLNLPEQWSRQRLRQLNENIQKFKQAIRIGDNSESRVDERKEGCVNGIKELIKNYKQVVDTQDQLLNKVLLKTKDFKASEMMALENKVSKGLDNNQLDRAKRFVEEHAQYLESKNVQLEKTRKMMQVAIKKAEESKKQLFRQKQSLQEEALEIRRSVEVLPAIIEQQLAKALN